jgi:hypothetical protein
MFLHLRLMFLLRLLTGLLCWSGAAAACAAEGATHRLIIHFREVRLRAAQMPDADTERALGVSAGMRVRGLRPMSGGAPVIFPIATQSVAPGASLSFTAISGDANGDAVTLSALAVPAGTTFDAARGVFNWPLC